ncbi:hypothetical protein [Paludisphaera soli]|uniref:hypothetical protein n=1 Tax=Paludisphaera soli TaxID=2712865 RepID=UPI0013EBD252|nr:hypothetical protein [Paludisphaera soli]
MSELLVELVQGLERMAEQSQAIDARSPERWDGEGWAYLEVEVPGVTGLEIDINVHLGRAYIRVER